MSDLANLAQRCGVRKQGHPNFEFTIAGGKKGKGGGGASAAPQLSHVARSDAASSQLDREWLSSSRRGHGLDE